jgi:serine protease Do
MEQNYLVEYRPAGTKKKRPIFRALTAILCVLALMFGSGYIGTKIALHNALSVGFVAEEAQTYNHTGAIAEVMISDNNSLDTPSEFTPASANTADTGNFTLPNLFEGANPAVVAISTETTGRNIFGQTVTRPASGSGFFVSPDGYIVTNDHVIENARNITVLLYDGTSRSATVVGRDAASDIALLKIDVTNRTYLKLGDSDSMRVGDQVAAIGNPLGELANSMTVGYISALNRNINVEGMTRTKLQTDAAVNRGNSGGPLLNLRGEVIGIVNAKSVGADVEGLGFAIPSNQAKDIIEQLMEHGFIRGRAILGVSINELQQTGGSVVQVTSVTRGGAAERAGIRTGDIILSANGVSISTFDELRAVLDELSPGDEIEVRVRRGNEERTFTAILDEYRPSGL